MKWTVTFRKFNQLKHELNSKQSAKKFNTKREAIAYVRSLGFISLGETEQFSKYFRIPALPSVLYLAVNASTSAVIAHK